MADHPANDEPHFDARDPSIAGDTNQLIWSGRPGQVLNLSTFMLAGATIALLWFWVPGALAFYSSLAIVLIVLIEFLRIHYTRYELTSDRLTKRWGLATTNMSRVPLYRVEDSGTRSPLIMRLAGRGNVYVISSDRSHPRLHLLAVRNPQQLEDILRDTYEVARARKGTRVIE